MPATSTPSTRLVTLRLGARYAPFVDTALLAAIETDRWQRDIGATAGAAGLQETYRSTRLVAGAQRQWQFAPVRLTLDAAAVLSSPERLRVGFSGVLDDAAFDTRRGHGIRLGAAFHPTSAGRFELRTGFDWIRHGRSADAPLTANGRFAGTVAQPEHERRAFSLTLAAVF